MYTFFFGNDTANYNIKLHNHVVRIQQFDWLSRIVTSRINNEGALFA